jgi:hypothetical protein
MLLEETHRSVLEAFQKRWQAAWQAMINTQLVNHGFLIDETRQRWTEDQFKNVDYRQG